MSAGERLTSRDGAEEQDQQRAGTWTLLGRLLAAPPGADLLHLLHGIQEGSRTPGDDMTVAWSTLRLAAQRTSPEQIASEYQDVFIGVGGGEVTPYGSWYLTGSLMERPLVLLRQDLEALGVERRADNSDPEDHAAALCEVMGLVINDPDVDFDWQREFFRRHLEPWMLRFFRDLQQAPSASFYKAVGGLGEAFVLLEQRFFAMPA
ncbi:MAG: molecular chaperone TorD family protein [Ectothiorhodospiraceae bacterium]|nr:molecular chaperone TorD family protein [Ectothiorhodospiraceae bacterium]